MKIKILTLFIFVISLSVYAVDEVKPAEVKSAETKVVLDQKLLFDDESKGIDTLFKNMIVVQKKAVERKSRFLLTTNTSFDYSDNPKSIYGMSFGAGFILFQNLEFHLAYYPLFVSTESSVVKSVRTETAAAGTPAEINSPDAKSATEASIYWVFAYGKDAFGTSTIIRNETFFKFSYTQIQYQEGLKGNRMGLFIGKTFFLSKNFNFRLSIGLARQDLFINLKPLTNNIGLIEPGLVWFL